MVLRPGAGMVAMLLQGAVAVMQVWVECDRWGPNEICFRDGRQVSLGSVVVFGESSRRRVMMIVGGLAACSRGRCDHDGSCRI